MYQPFFGLTRRPFSATPDINFFFRTEAVDAANAAVVNCLVSGQGIAVITGPPGMGKTAFCQHLVAEFPAPFHVAFLSNSNFPTRRSLLQAILFELGQPYSNMGEQELRLELTACLRSMHQQEQPVVLVVDEAHLLNNRILEELRTIADLTIDGAPLMRLLLCGQLWLDERLAHPSMEALNQRISTQVYLESLTRQESVDYIAYRLSVAGIAIDEAFTPDALDLIVQASDGMPRCINQLCDHSLLLGYMVENKPIDAELAREALDDLKQLPLHWNEPTVALSPLDQLRQPSGSRRDAGDREQSDIESAAADETYGLIESAAPNDSDYDEAIETSSAAFEFGADDEDVGETVSEQPASAVPQAIAANVRCDGEWEEEVVVDRYSQLDAEFEQTGRKSFRTQYPLVSAVDQPVEQPSVAEDDEFFEVEAALELVFDEDESQEVIEADSETETFDLETCIAEVNVSIEAAESALQTLIGAEMPVELTAQWDTLSMADDDESTLYDADDLSFGGEDLSNLNIPSQLVQALQSRGCGHEESQEEQLARQMIDLIEESKSFARPAHIDETPSSNTWFGSNDLYSDLQECDPFDDESAFASSKKFDVIQPDDGAYDEPRTQPLFPPTLASEKPTVKSSDRTYEPHPAIPPARVISPKSFVRLFSELRKRQQRSA